MGHDESSISPAKAAQLLATLARADERTLPQFAAMTGAGKSFSREELAAVQAHLCCVAGWLEHDTPERWRELGWPQARASAVPPPAASSDPSLDSLNSTAMLDPSLASALADEPSTPFDGRAPAPPPHPVEPHPEQGQTASLPIVEEVDALTAAREELPMDVERYAALVACTEGADALQQAVVHAEYGVADFVHRQRIDAAFASALEQDAALRRRFEHHHGRWRAWLRRG